MMDQFIHAKTLPALKTDALSTSHPVSVPVKDPVEIEAIFDTISYNKVQFFSILNSHKQIDSSSSYLCVPLHSPLHSKR